MERISSADGDDSELQPDAEETEATETQQVQTHAKNEANEKRVLGMKPATAYVVITITVIALAVGTYFYIKKRKNAKLQIIES